MAKKTLGKSIFEYRIYFLKSFNEKQLQILKKTTTTLNLKKVIVLIRFVRSGVMLIGPIFNHI